MPRHVLAAAITRFGLALGLFACLSVSPALTQDVDPIFPRFRHVDSDSGVTLFPVAGEVVLLADRDFAPWSFEGEDGVTRGVSVELALSACAATKLNCRIKPMPFAELRAALSRGEGQAIISGLRLDDGLFTEALFTRPYFVSLGRFAVRLGTSLPSNDVRALTGKRLGFVKDSAHAVFLQRYYGKAQLTPYDTQDAALEALRTGALDAVFGDALGISYWLAGSKSRNCCQALGKAFVDRSTFSRELVFVLPKDQENLRNTLDAALDGLEAKGETARVFSSYLLGPVW